MRYKIAGFLTMLMLLLGCIGATALADEWSEVEVTIDGETMTLTSDYSSDLVPEGYTETLLIYDGGEYYGCLDDNTSTRKLFYIRSSDEKKTGWYELGTDNMTFTKFDPSAVGLPNDFGETEPGTIKIPEMTLHISEPPSDEEIPEGYVETNIAGDANLLKAYQVENAEGLREDMYVVYGSLDGYNYSWYSYDLRDSTIQRFSNTDSQIANQQATSIEELQTKLSELNDQYNHNVGRSKNLFLITLILCVLFFFLMLNAMIKRRHVTLDLEDRIIDLKNNGGQETQVYSGRDSRINAKLDAKARARSITYQDEPISDMYEDGRGSRENSWYSDLDGNDLKTLANPERGIRNAEEPLPYLDEEEDESLYKAFDDLDRKPSRAQRAPKGVKSVKTSKKPVPQKKAQGGAPVKRSPQGTAPKRPRPDMNPERTKQPPVKKGHAPSGREESMRAERPMPEDAYGTNRVIAGAQQERRASLSGTQPILDQVIRNKIKEAEQERNFTIAAAGAIEDFDLEALERTLGEHAEEAINSPRKPLTQPRVKPDIKELQRQNADSGLDFIDL